jgi:polyribonucleotide nucleotidyltransferase
MKEVKVEQEIGGKKLILSTGKLAKQAKASVVVQYGETVVLVSLVSAPLEEAKDFVPLTVDYRERTYAAGKIPGGFFKREGKPREKEVLSSRVIDRPLRPLFPKGIKDDIMINAIVLSSDGENDSDLPALIGASAAVVLAGFPFNGPIGAVRIGYINGEFVINPSFTDLQNKELELIVVGTKDRITMLEGNSKEVSEDIVLKAIKKAETEVNKIIDLQIELAKKCGVELNKVSVKEDEMDKYVQELIPTHKEKIKKAITIFDKLERAGALDKLKEEIVEKYKEIDETGFIASTVYERLSELCFKELIVKDKKRPDSRAFDEVRDISCEVGILPRTHGSGLFTRGQTQALAIATLGTPRDMQIIDDLEGEYKKRFMLHYNFPSFAVGEARPNRGPGRREIGHGNLAERALEAVLPDDKEFPYTIRIVSDILESNGSSSMASVCGGSLALMDAGVPIKSPVAGISVGLVQDKENILLVDIAGFEDHFGDMDFKIAGTEKGITAIQLDVKVSGLDDDTIVRTFEISKKSRLKILDIMNKTLNKSREATSTYAPKIEKVIVPTDKIRLVIGQGGKTIKKIMEEADVEIDVEDTGEVTISAKNFEGLKIAREMVQLYTAEAEVGKIYKGKVMRLMSFGAFVEILPGKEGLVHISQLSDKRVEKVEDVVKEGDEINVKLVEIDAMGRLNLSKKAADKE